jgi:hypothetical protein
VDDHFAVEDGDRVDRRLRIRENQRRLMIGAAQRAERNAAPHARRQAMHAAGEDVAHIAVPRS